MIYLASPYTSNDPDVVYDRYMKTLKTMAILLNKKLYVYSPIVHCHMIARNHNLPKDYLFWKSYNEHFLSLSSDLFVLCLLGWKESKGVTHEIEFAKQMMPIKYIDESGELITQ